MSATLNMELGPNSYDIVIERGCSQKAGQLMNLNRKVLIVTDSGVPAQYAETVAAQCKVPVIHTIPQGEESKSLQVFETLLRDMLAHDFTRGDCVAAVGGGVCGDLAGFAAACYMRGIDFYNLPTTVLSQVDSSIGGKTAVDLAGIKNIVGAFYQPKKVLIDPDVLTTLPPRQISAGLAEALKMSLTSDPELFAIFEAGKALEQIDEVIRKSLEIKKYVVEQDEKEQGLRRILNFGHTIGHGIESVSALSDRPFYHGECVAMGMLPMCSPALRQRLLPVLEQLKLPTCCSLDGGQVYEAMLHDKKASADGITIVEVSIPGSYRLTRVAPEALKPGIDLLLTPEKEAEA